MSVSRPVEGLGILLLVLENCSAVCVVCELFQVSKQGQNKIQASYIRKYPKTRMILIIFEIVS